ncbi:hypothetical protein [Streptomyces sp. NPDC047000]|uniref:hypothetical protein n=1 Tax=Streptomyces sp. NPDC047000 TaxID=3155474 RepID=UPI0033CC065E
MMDEVMVAAAAGVGVAVVGLLSNLLCFALSVRIVPGVGRAKRISKADARTAGLPRPDVEPGDPEEQAA